MDILKFKRTLLAIIDVLVYNSVYNKETKYIE